MAKQGGRSRHRGQHSRNRHVSKAFGAILGAALPGTTAYAAASWTISLNSNSSGEGQSASIQNLTIAAVASPAATNLLYPGGTGDVVATITNPNPYPVTITAVSLPSSSTYATGYTNSSLSTANTNCTATTSLVAWSYASGTNPHTLTNPLVVAANGTLTVTFTNDASMNSSSPQACAGTYFSMPSLTGITATGGAATSTSSPATDGWTS